MNTNKNQPRGVLVALSLMVVLSFHAGTAAAQTFQVPSSCTSDGGTVLCVPATVTYYEVYDSRTFTNGNDACAAAPGPTGAAEYQNGTYYVNYQGLSFGCLYDYYSPFLNYTYQGQLFEQEWAGAGQVCPDLENIRYYYTDTTDLSVSTSGRKWCGYTPYYLRVPPVDKAQCGLCIPDPINPANGAVFDTIADTSATPGSLNFKRFYNSTNSDDVGMSSGWRHSYSRSVTPRYDNALFQPWVSSPNNSSMYGDPATACTAGFSQIQGQLKLSTASVTATYSAGVCLIKSGGTVITALPIYSTSTVGLIIQTIPIAYDVTRDDGQLITFWLNNASIMTPPSIDLQLQQTATGFTITDANDNVEQYDTTGKLLTVTSRGGVVQTMTYDSSGNLSNVSDSFGHQLILNYNTQNQLTTVTRQ